MDVMERARLAEHKGRDIVHMEIGQPATGAPQKARSALAEAMAAGPLGYTVGLGLPELRARIARMYHERYGVDLDPGRVVVTAGSSSGFVLSFLSLFDAGERVAIADPGYPSYRNILSALDLKAHRIEGTLANRFQPRPSDLSDDMAGLLVASPANPTGSVLGRTELADLIEACTARGISFISDEIYHGISFGPAETTALSISDDVVVINSFSKYHGMTGWRVGWMVVPPDMVRTVEKLAQNLFICAPHASQVAALAALDAGEELESRVADFARNRNLLAEALPRLGFREIAPPDGAFYIYANIAHWGLPSREFCARMLDEAGIATTPGLDFDPVRGHDTIRFSYAGAPDRMHEAVRRLEAWIPTLERV